MLTKYIMLMVRCGSCWPSASCQWLSAVIMPKYLNKIYMTFGLHVVLWTNEEDFILDVLKFTPFQHGRKETYWQYYVLIGTLTHTIPVSSTMKSFQIMRKVVSKCRARWYKCDSYDSMRNCQLLYCQSRQRWGFCPQSINACSVNTWSDRGSRLLSAC